MKDNNLELEDKVQLNSRKRIYLETEIKNGLELKTEKKEIKINLQIKEQQEKNNNIKLNMNLNQIINKIIKKDKNISKIKEILFHFLLFYNTEKKRREEKEIKKAQLIDSFWNKLKKEKK